MTTTPLTLDPIKTKYRAMWALGNYDNVATEVIQDLGTRIVEAAGIAPGDRVLDVAAGSGNASLPAARAGGQVLATDITPELLETGRQRAEAAGLDITWREADAEHLRCEDAEYDAVLSLVGMRVLRRRERGRLAAGERTHDEAITDRDRPMSDSRAWSVLGLGIAALLVVAAPATQMRLGLPDGSTQPPDSSGYLAHEVQAEKFGEGSNGPLLVVADLPEAIVEDEVVAEQAAVGDR